MPTKTLHGIDVVIRIVITAFFSLFPVFFLPLLPEYYDTGKWILLVSTALILLILYGVRILVSGTIVVPRSSAVSGLLSLAAASLISLIFISVNRIEALVNPLGFASFFSFTIIISATIMYRDVFIRQWVRWGILASFSLIGILAVYQALGMGKLLSSLLPFLNDVYWTPAGNIFVAAAALAIVVPISVWSLREAYIAKHDAAMILSVITTIAITAGLAVTVYRAYPRYAGSVLPFDIAWNILLESYKHPSAALAGVGAESFVNAFTAGKSMLINLTPVWNMRFSVSANTLFHIATTFGFIGFAAILILLKTLVLPFAMDKHPEWTVSAFIAVLALVLMPPSIVIVGAIAAILVLKPHGNEDLQVLPIPQTFQWIGTVTAIVCFIISANGLYFLGRHVAAERMFAKSLQSAKANDGKNTYEQQARAIVLNPYMSTYHLSFAQVNIALATGIITSTTKQRTDTSQQVKLSEDDQKTISQLIQQGISQAKLAISLAPKNNATWETLGRIYENIVGVVQEADTWAIAAYQQEVQLDPATPQSRLNLAAAYMTKKDFINARDQLLIAIQLKPDIANIHYNLSYVYKNLKDYPNQKLALENTMKYLTAGSEDVKKVQSEIDLLNAQTVPEQTPQVLQATASPSAQQVIRSPLVTPPEEPKTQVMPKLELTQ